ncbi:MAG: MerR family transcriptional regulator [Gemmatimonadaceae bacterium]
MLTEPTTYDLNELADAAGVTTRTIRYYVAQGLLPSPGTRGPGTRYDRGHLNRLQLVKSLQRQHLPLAEIRRQLESLDDVGVREALRSAPDAPHPSSALSYVRGLLGKDAAHPGGDELRIGALALPTPAPKSPARSLAETLFGRSDRKEEAAPPPSESKPSSVAKQPRRSIWDRLALSPDVELHVRRPLSREQNRQVDRLLDAARQIFSEEP